MATCVICNHELEDVDAICCGKPSCVHLLDEIPIDNKVVEFAGLYGEEVVIFHFRTALDALRSNRAENVYEPVPSIAFREKDMSKRFNMTALTNETHQKDLLSLKNMLSKESPESLLKKIKTYSTDLDLSNTEGKNMYAWIKFTLSASLVILKSEHILDINKKPILQVIEIKSQSWSASYDDTIVRFHASHVDAWYSIIRNGLQVLSKTSMQVHGNAFGDGIYTSNQLAVSRSYSPWVAVCWVNKKFVAKTSSHTVVTSSEGIQIKAIIDTSRLPYDTNQKLEQILIERYKMQQPASLSSSSMKGPRNRRIMKDYKQLQTESPHTIVNFKEDEFLNVWRIIEVDQEMLKKVGGRFEIEIHFLNDYPFKPPFVWMILPRLEPNTGHITQGGAICMKELTNEGWQSSNTVYTVIQAIKGVIEMGDGVLSTAQKPYNFADAKASFERIKLQHGWV